ncbi:unnamed protein product [Cyprideis torosa]|uniref:FAD-dependent oxidoreductase domain-containing protein 1 n=1 Tax=Cyprideis torosa TaxID=163714 RepID=A0A7R8W2W8_9CRUS|nr:unnamed protein product [Cyprideis torosa]CAG0882431.1 unnamed protein product [Cyprideis torosa]
MIMWSRLLRLNRRKSFSVSSSFSPFSTTVTRGKKDEGKKDNKGGVDGFEEREFMEPNTEYQPDRGFMKRMEDMHERDIAFPYFTDVLIIGGGAIGAAAAHFLMERHEKINVTVIEKDPTYKRSSTALSVGGIRTQFSTAESIQMSQFGYEFLRKMKMDLRVGDDEPPDPGFNPNGYVFTATEDQAEQLVENVALQQRFGARVELLSPGNLQERFPWLNTEGIAIASYGLEGEGWFDPWALLMALKRKAISRGVRFIDAEVCGVIWKGFQGAHVGEIHDHMEKVEFIKVRMNDTGEVRKIQAGYYVIAAGAASGKVGELLGIGTSSSSPMLRHRLPVEPRKRYVYTIHCPDGPGLNCPMFVDTNGVYFRREGLGGLYLCGASPPPEMPEPPTTDYEVDYEFFNEYVWPKLAHRVPAFESVKMRSAWAGMYDYNTFDENGIVGVHPHLWNVIIATGFSGHGIQHAAAVGRAVSELCTKMAYQTINLDRFSFERIIINKPLLESNIV